MGFRRLAFLLSVTFALTFVGACGDNRHPIFEDAGSDGMGSGTDADAPPDALNCGAAPQMNCNGACVDTSQDESNCGTCGTSCGSGETCSSGLCCATGLINCGGTCVDPNSDEAHCGTCATTCTTGQTCQNGTCCGGSNTACGNQCFDLTNTHDHCGTCNTACGANETCSSGMCCPNGQISCNGTCVDPNSDEAHCGTCATTCNTGAGETCDMGHCCATGTAWCASANACIDTKTDSNNCGTCGNMCGSGTTCSNGVCCGTGSISCNGTTCTNTNNDPNNCGACAASGGDTCVTGETCDNGLCCGPGQQHCGAACVDVNNDFNNCGACGQMCATGEVCSSGSCVATGCASNEVQCPAGSGNCVNTQTNHDFCGTCGTACAPNEVCSAGVCTSACSGGTTACSGDCVDTTSDPSHCGTCATNCGATETCSSGKCCPSGSYNSGGICCAIGQTNTGGICCPTGWLNCSGTCKDPNADTSCGSCTNNCTTSNGTCEADQSGTTPVKCCPAGQTNCNGTCVDTTTSAGNCGACGATCAGTCDDGVCCATGETHCATAPGNGCVDLTTSAGNCGACGAACASGESCTDGHCCPTGSQWTTDQNGQNGTCCGSTELNCGGICTDIGTSNANCGGCGMACGSGQFCNGGMCSAQCTCTGCSTTCGVCTNTNTDPNNCGASCQNCPIGGSCNSGSCACPVTAPTTCSLAGGSQVCVDTTGNNSNCGGCGAAFACASGNHCSTGSVNITTATAVTTTATITTSVAHGLVVGQIITITGNSVAAYNGTWTVSTVPTTTTFKFTMTTNNPANGSGGKVTTGECCAQGTESCNGACVDKNSDNNNCGTCGNVCGNGTSCISGSCQCAFGQTQCGTSCKTLSVDPTNCGGCGTVCGSGANAGKPYCVSGGCTATCPAPLSACGSGANAKCTNLTDDDKNCGACGTDCTNGGLTPLKGCSAGTCVDRLIPVQNPARCAGGGPPIIVDDGTTQQCTGNIGAVSFRFAVCALTGYNKATGTTSQQFGIGPLSRDLVTDAFDSTKGPYVAGAAVYGGGIGVNGSTQSSGTTTVGGDFWVFGSTGMQTKGLVDVKQRLYVRNSFDFSKTTTVRGLALANSRTDTAYIVNNTASTFTSGGAGTMAITGDLHTRLGTGTGATCFTKPGGLTVSGQTYCGESWTMAPPCDSTADLLPIRAWVKNAKTNNDNASIGLTTQALNGNSNITRLDLPCGKYYLDTLQIGKTTTIVVHGRTALFIGGSVRISQQLIFDLDPTATLDIFVGGVVNVSNSVTLGSPAFPRLTRLYIGNSQCLGSGTCTDDTQCCSGVCSAGVCTSGGGNLSQAMSLSQGGYFNGLIYAGYGVFTHSNPLEMYGSIFSDYFDASGDTLVHYDKGAITTGDECPQPPTQACESCRDCNNQACVNNSCGACTSDSQCCAPLHCNTGNGKCEL